MKLERSKVDHPLWRKKVDMSLFEHKNTVIPGWASDMWDLRAQFKTVISKKDDNAKVNIRFKRRKHPGWLTVAKKGQPKPRYRLWFDRPLATELKHKYAMSYMRSLEQRLSPSNDEINAEETIPFWEFLDIEYDRKKREFMFEAYYRQEPSFPNLFKRLAGSPAIAANDNEIHGKKDRIIPQDWKPRSELEHEIFAKNVIYMLADSTNKLLYVGESKDLVKRLSQEYPTIPRWDQFRYDVLPTSLAKYRVAIERMMIRSFATLFSNKKSIENLVGISTWQLANEKIDK